MVTNQDKDEEEIYLNPHKIEEIQQRKMERQEKERIELLNEEKIAEIEKKRFDVKKYEIEEGKYVTDRERMMHPEIPPAKIRIQDFKRKDLNEKYQKTANELKAGPYFKRPMTSGAPHSQSLSQAELTTQAQSSAAFEETEGAYNEYPFTKFYSTNDNVAFKT